MRPPRGRGGNAGNRGGAGGRGGRGGGRGGKGGFGGRDEGPPSTVQEIGIFTHPCESEMVYKSVTSDLIPMFNANIYTENKVPIGKVEEVMGPINEVYFSVKPVEGVNPASYKPGDKVYIAPDKLLPKERFLPKEKPTGAPKSKPQGQQGKNAGRGRGGARGGRGGRGGARGGARGGGRGGARGRGGGAGRGGFGGRGGRGRGGF